MKLSLMMKIEMSMATWVTRCKKTMLIEDLSHAQIDHIKNLKRFLYCQSELKITFA
jgi:hypothetical protein